MAELKQRVTRIVNKRTAPHPSHTFLRLLHAKGQLLRNYTQNIDGLEVLAVPHPSERLSFVKLPGVVTDQEGWRAEESDGEDDEAFEGEVVLLHGSLMSVRCTHCAWSGPWEEEHTKAFADGETPPCPACTARSELDYASRPGSCL